jgi:mono/diheme cytochrome c family protein
MNWSWIAVAAAVGAAIPGMARAAESRTGREVYRHACAACHGDDGRGLPETVVGFEVPLPDFTDCSFATREPDTDWYAVAHAGGPARGFDRLMPAFGDALSEREIQASLDFVRTFCDQPAWPRGELNLPLPLVTEKAYPEDELVITTSVGTGELADFELEIVYEKRLGARSQLEVIVPFGIAEREVEGTDPVETDWGEGIGDIAVGGKHVIHANLATGTILSVGAELILPTGDEADGFGGGLFVLEPFALFGAILPLDSFLHLQVGAELPFDSDDPAREGFARGALGKTFTSGRFGRGFSPIIEVLVARPLEDDASTEVDLVPQLHITLNRRQHVRASAGVRVPVTQTGERDEVVMFYLLWDWFDGGFREGW